MSAASSATGELLSAIFNLTLSAMGAGVLSFGLAFAKMGLVLGICLTVSAACISWIAVYVLMHYARYATDVLHVRLYDPAEEDDQERASDSITRTADTRVALAKTSSSAAASTSQRMTSPVSPSSSSTSSSEASPPSAALLHTYEQLVLHILGPWAYRVTVACVLITTIGALIGYMIIIGDIMEPVLTHRYHHHWYTSRAFTTGMFALTLAFPLSCLRSFKELSVSSALAVAAVVAVVVAVVYRGGETLHDEGGVPDYVEHARWSSSILVGLPIVVFSFGNTLAVVPNFAELSPQTRARSSSIITAYAVLCCIVYAVVGAAGYIHFGPDVKGDILEAFKPDDAMGNVARALMAVHVALAYPVILLPARRSLNKYVFRRPGALHDVSTREFCAQTFGIVLVTYLVAVLYPKVSVVFGLLGASTATVVGWLLPALMLLSPHGLRSEPPPPLPQLTQPLIGGSMPSPMSPASRAELRKTRLDDHWIHGETYVQLGKMLARAGVVISIAFIICATGVNIAEL